MLAPTYNFVKNICQFQHIISLKNNAPKMESITNFTPEVLLNVTNHLDPRSLGSLGSTSQTANQASRETVMRELISLDFARENLISKSLRELQVLLAATQREIQLGSYVLADDDFRFRIPGSYRQVVPTNDDSLMLAVTPAGTLVLLESDHERILVVDGIEQHLRRRIPKPGWGRIIDISRLGEDSWLTITFENGTVIMDLEPESEESPLFENEPPNYLIHNFPFRVRRYLKVGILEKIFLTDDGQVMFTNDFVFNRLLSTGHNLVGRYIPLPTAPIYQIYAGWSSGGPNQERIYILVLLSVFGKAIVMMWPGMFGRTQSRIESVGIEPIIHVEIMKSADGPTYIYFFTLDRRTFYTTSNNLIHDPLFGIYQIPRSGIISCLRAPDLFLLENETKVKYDSGNRTVTDIDSPLGIIEESI